MEPRPCARIKNPCKYCLQTVNNKNGLRCEGACRKWAHFKCLNFTPGKISDIKAGIIKIMCPCPDCETTVPKEILVNPPYTCGNHRCPANMIPTCGSVDYTPKQITPSPSPCMDTRQAHSWRHLRQGAQQGNCNTPSLGYIQYWKPQPCSSGPCKPEPNQSCHTQPIPVQVRVSEPCTMQLPYGKPAPPLPSVPELYPMQPSASETYLMENCPIESCPLKPCLQNTSSKALNPYQNLSRSCPQFFTASSTGSEQTAEANHQNMLYEEPGLISEPSCPDVALNEQDINQSDNISSGLSSNENVKFAGVISSSDSDIVTEKTSMAGHIRAINSALDKLATQMKHLLAKVARS